jgi:hypothetical protein
MDKVQKYNSFYPLWLRFKVKFEENFKEVFEVSTEYKDYNINFKV